MMIEAKLRQRYYLWPFVNLIEAPVPETLTIVITSDDIKNGVRFSPMMCPIALAARRALQEWDGDVLVGSNTIEFHAYHGKSYYWRLPKNLARALSNFDGSRRFTDNWFPFFGKKLTGQFEIPSTDHYE
jgi:hypothetical protein